MYLPKHFEETRVEVLHALVRAHPLGALVTHGAAGLEANHVPFEIDPAPAPFGTLRGHVARANPVWRDGVGDAPTAVLIDKDGKVGRLYGARTTPHMYVIDPQGRLIYAGAIDDRRFASAEETKAAKNHVRAALGEAMAGKPVSVAATTPYGCSVKY